MLPNGMKYRYEFYKTIKDGIPCLQVNDNYLAPLVINEYFFKFDDNGINELKGYGHAMINIILDIISGANRDKKGLSLSHIVMRDSMSRVKQALEELGEAMEDYDYRTGSKSSFSFQSTPIEGDIFTSEVKNDLIAN